ncbi:hypothetical protein AB6813_11980 [bacterium RCC_150]
MISHQISAALAGAVLALGTLACGGCAPPSPASQTAPVPSPTPTGTASLSAGEHPQAQGPATPPVASWDAGSEQNAKDTATRAMTLFARPQADQRQWITDLAPLLSPAYRADAEYINPARVPVSRILAGPVLQTSAGDPMTVKAVYSTNAGEWVVLLHRAGQPEPWMVQAITPTND